MPLKIILDPGHGGKDPGAVYKNRKEKDDVLALSLALAKELRKYGILVDETRTTDKFVSLSERSNMGNKKQYDYFISIHRNAFKPEVANGVEIYTYINPSDKSKKLANKIQSKLVNLGFKNRGVKNANFHVLKATKAPAILLEIGFIDNSFDNCLFDFKFGDLVEAICQAVLDMK